MKYETISLRDYWEMLNKHDWYFIFSDDSRVYSAGAMDADKLIRYSSLSQEHHDLYEAFRKHHFTGKPWDTEQTSKPQKPE